MGRFKRITTWLAAFLLAVAVIAVYKTFDNFNMIWLFLWQIVKILYPFIAGFIIAFLLYKPSRWLEELFLRSKKKLVRRISRPVSVAIVYVVIFSVLALVITFAIPSLVRGIVNFASHLPEYYQSVIDYLYQLNLPGDWMAKLNVEDNLKQLTDFIVSKINMESISQYAKGIASAASSVVSSILAVIVSVYMLLGRESLLTALRMILSLFIPEKRFDILSRYTKRSTRIFYGFLYSQGLDALVMSTISAIGMAITGVPYGAALGFAIGIFNIIPYFGAIIACVLLILITLLSKGFYMAIFFSIYILIFQQIDANIIQPRIVSSNIGLRPIYVLFAITIGGGLFGFWGIFLGVPVAAIVRMLLLDYIEYRKTHDGIFKKMTSIGRKDKEDK